VTYLVLVTGLPASGKTTLGQRLASELEIPFLAKDAIKETLYDTLGWSDRAHSRRLGAASFALLYTILDALLAAGVSAVVEAPFDPDGAATDLQSLRDRHPFHIVQVICHAEGEVLVERYRARNASGQRHRGHVETDILADVEEYLRAGNVAPVAIESDVIEVDTTAPESVDHDTILSRIRRLTDHPDR
jgi:predicted kinase